MVQFIVDTIASRPDSYGNTYLFSWVKSTKSGKSIATLSDGDDNVKYIIQNLLRKRIFDFNQATIHSTYKEIPIREWYKRRKEIKLMEYDITKEMLLDLEK